MCVVVSEVVDDSDDCESECSSCERLGTEVTKEATGNRGCVGNVRVLKFEVSGR
jgi:hypothetical protein